MSFDRLAPHYRWMEAVLVGGLMQRCRTHWMNEVRDSRHALFVGEGNGRMLEACATALPECRFTVLDRSEEMLRQARRRWKQSGGSQPITFEQADLRYSSAVGDKYDLIVTNFFLDCFSPEELPQVISNISLSASARSRWLVADFCLPQNGWRRARARASLALAYGFFRVTTGISARRITPPDDALSAAGFVLQKREHFNFGMLNADLWEREYILPA